MSEVEKYPMGYAYKKTEILDSEGNTSEQTIPFFPYTKTFAITNKDNVNLDVVLEELRNWEGYPITTDITWSTPGVYALDASVGGEYYKLCQQVFQSADSALRELCRIVGLTYNESTNFTTALAEFKSKINIIKNTINTYGGNCPDNPTLAQINASIIGAPRLNIKTKNFTVRFSYNEIKNFEKESPSYYAVYIDVDDYINDCETILCVVNNLGNYYTSSGNVWHGPVRIFYNDVYIGGMHNVYDGTKNLGGLLQCYTENYNFNTGKTTYSISDHNNHYTFNYNKDNCINCEAYHIMRAEGSYITFGIPDSYLNNVANSDWYGWDGITKEDKAQWKAEKNIFFDFQITYIAK